MNKLHNLFLASSGITTDTRSIIDNCIFFALTGANFNGNDFALSALENGASHAVVDDPTIATLDNRCILVDDVLKTLQKLANYHRQQFNIPVIGITGSNGKTTTKELIANVLIQQYNVLFTKGNLNNHIGVPLTLLQLRKEHEIAVIEMGANHPGDIKELCDIAAPNFGIITNIGKAHLEGFLNFEGVLRTKKELYDEVLKNKGVLFYNADDSVLTENIPAIESYSYSKKHGTVIGNLTALTPFVEFSYQIGEYTSPVLKTNIVGEYNFYNFLASIVIGDYFNVPLDKINRGIEEYQPTNNRSQVEKTTDNTLIIDCYNANPTSMSAAIHSFHQIDSPNKLLIIGDMRELGSDALIEHQAIVQLIEDLKLKAILIGAEFAQTKHHFPHFMHTEEVLNSKMKLKNHLILLKGSRGIGLEKIIPML